MRRSGSFLFPVLALWAVSVAAAFWQFEGRYLPPAARPSGAAVARPEALPAPPLSHLAPNLTLTSGRITFVQFYNPDCPCSRDNEAHLRELTTRYPASSVRFIAVVECGATPSEQAAARRVWRERSMPDMEVALDPGGVIARAFGVWATPGAVILDRRGRVAYTGGFNAARFCHNPATAWAAQALAALEIEHPVPHPSMPFYGCQVQSR